MPGIEIQAHSATRLGLHPGAGLHNAHTEPQFKAAWEITSLLVSIVHRVQQVSCLWLQNTSRFSPPRPIPRSPPLLCCLFSGAHWPLAHLSVLQCIWPCKCPRASLPPRTSSAHSSFCCPHWHWGSPPLELSRPLPCPCVALAALWGRRLITDPVQGRPGPVVPGSPASRWRFLHGLWP